MKLLSILAVAAVLIAVGNSSASAAERDGRNGGFGDRRQGGASGSGRSGFMQNMDPKVMEAMREAFREAGGSARELAGKEQKLRRELTGLITSGQVDEKAIRDKVMALAEVQVETTVLRAKMLAKMKKAGASDELLKMLASRMGGGGQRPGGMQGGGEGMRRGNLGGDKAGFGREGVGDRDRRPDRGKPNEAESKKRRPEFK
ncbi:MAG: Spy/CpxP family protein refolding chaperone [Limisphaerales bacterium]